MYSFNPLRSSRSCFVLRARLQHNGSTSHSEIMKQGWDQTMSAKKIKDFFFSVCELSSRRAAQMQKSVCVLRQLVLYCPNMFTCVIIVLITC